MAVLFLNCVHVYIIRMAELIAMCMCVLCMGLVETRKDCEVQHTPDSGYTANCGNLNLTTIPLEVLTEELTSLDLSRNRIMTLQEYAFSGSPNLLILNLSMAGISVIQNNSFGGLHKLDVLDLRQNVAFFNRPLPRGLFAGCPHVRTLNVVGDCFDPGPLSVMTQLRELSVLPCHNTTGYRNLSLTSLRVLTFAFCSIGTTLTKDFLQPFTYFNIEEMTFHQCYLRHIENRTFDDFVSLRLLNFALNGNLGLDTIIDSISSSSGVAVERLILDYAGNELGGHMVLGQHHDHPVCRSAWSNLRHLSARAMNIVGLTGHFANCLPNIQTLSIGYNIFQLGKQIMSTLEFIVAIFKMLNNILSLDISHMSSYSYVELFRQLGYKNRYRWIPANQDYFVPIINSSENAVADRVHNHSGCIRVGGLPNCRYLDMSYLYIMSALTYNDRWRDEHNFDCLIIMTSALVHLNLSNIIVGPNKWIYPVIIGLDMLEILDLSNNQLLAIELDNLRYMPMLRVLHLERNLLGMGNLGIFPLLNNLQKLDLTSNSLNKLPIDTFKNLPFLSELYLSGNTLENIDFLDMSLRTLNALDLSGNHLSDLSPEMTITLSEVFTEKQNFVLDIRFNPLQCECDELNFMAWMQSTHVNIKDIYSLTCLQGTNNVLVREINVEQQIIHCGLTINVMAISCSTIFIGVGIITTAIVVYRYRWSIKWRYFKMKYNAKKRRDEILLHDPSGSMKYSAYVIFPLEDDVIRSWVFTTLRPKVESEWQRPAMFLNGRDDIAGDTYVDNIVRGISESQTAIWVVCPGFQNDHHCFTASNFALEHLGAQNNILLVLETEFHNYSTPAAFRNLLNPKLGITRIRWTADEDGRELFWGELSRLMPAWTHY